MDYGDKPAAARWSLFTPPRRSLFAPPLTATGLRAISVKEILQAFHELFPDHQPVANSANSAKSLSANPQIRPIGTNGTNGTAPSDCGKRTPDAKTEASKEWDAEDWRAFYDERAAICEHDGDVSRVEAEREAFKACIAEWLRRNPVPSQPGTCAHCGEPETPGSGVVIPFGTDTNGHTWLHHACWRPWSANQRTAAIQALSDISACGTDQPRFNRGSHPSHIPAPAC